MVFKDAIYHVVLHFSKSVLQINQSDYKCSLVFLSMSYEVYHVSYMFICAHYFWGKALLDVVFCISMLWQEFKDPISYE